jgi:thioredoxin-like negative regulator of GroEL
VLLDFSAVWCPPCNQLADEVLHADPPPAELAGFEVAIVDVDHPSSFALKSRYGVGGYPTIVVADAEGAERTRMVGYPNRDAFVGWLAGAGSSTDAADLALPASALTPERAAELAWALVQQGETERVEPLIARAEAGGAPVIDGVPLRLARLRVRHDAADLEWLLAHAPERALDYGLSAPELAEEAPDLARRAVDAALRQARGVDVAAALEAAAELAPDEATKRALYSAAIGVVRSTLTGAPDHDKPYIGWLAGLLEDAGDPDGALSLLDDALGTWPDEPTFDLVLAPMLTRLQRYDEAIASADRALSRSWGDNRLRAALAKGEALIASGARAEAVALVEAELAAQPAPDPTLAVRTHRYRAKLEALVAPAPAPAD